MGSNITNIALIIGLVHCQPYQRAFQVVRKELPFLLGIPLLCRLQLIDRSAEAAWSWVLLGVFLVLMGWVDFPGHAQSSDAPGNRLRQGTQGQRMPAAPRHWIWLVVRPVLLCSARAFWSGAGYIAQSLGRQDLIIWFDHCCGLAPSLPELARRLWRYRRTNRPGTGQR